ncbi:MAG TPA: serine/threonine-protein kinase [Gemmatales bacterium]|nr:serine/threonine-protein kinase [Gemmatales bacterium]HMP58320.1 serine/threonine-protein kinase [Gemmatales bacterium]
MNHTTTPGGTGPTPGPDQTLAHNGPGSEETQVQTKSFEVSTQDADSTQPFLGQTTTPAASDTVLAGGAETTNVDLLSAKAEQLQRQPIRLGDFEISQKLGQGGMGAVFKAKQLSLDREVALKVLAKHLADNEEFVIRFYREAKVMAKLDHENVIRCYGVGQDKGLHYMAMEYVDGGTLQNWLDKQGRFSVGDALHATLACAYALEHAHDLKLVHRDIKPDNALITKKGVVKVADLGLAKPTDDDLALTQTGVGAGTPHFMAPEQMRNAKDVDGRADIYALGCQLYYLLTGEKPFKGTTLVDLIKEKELGRFTSARKLNPDVPDRLDLIIDKMMSKSLSARYQTCRELINDLENLGLAHPVLSFLGIEGPRPSSIRRSGTSPTSGPSSGTLPTPIPEEKPTGDTWFVSIGFQDGKRRVKKMTTAQIIDSIKCKAFDAKVEVSRQAGTGYRALGTWPEFELVNQRDTQKSVDRRTQEVKREHRSTVREIERDLRWRSVKRFLKETAGWLYLLIGLGVLGGIGFAVYLYWPQIMGQVQSVKEQVQERIQSPAQ